MNHNKLTTYSLYKQIEDVQEPTNLQIFYFRSVLYKYELYSAIYAISNLAMHIGRTNTFWCIIKAFYENHSLY